MGIMTVNGVISKEQLGVTTPHEHALIDISNQYPGDCTPGSVGFDGKVAPQYYAELMLDPYLLRDNLMLECEELAIREVAAFAKAGGQSFVDLTVEGIGRNVAFLKRLSKETGLHVVTCCGFYTGDAHPARLKSMSIAQIADEMVRELTEGIDGTEVKAGIIGEIGTSTEIMDEEIRVLKASAIAHKRTGAPIMVHLSPWAQHGQFVTKLLLAEGVDPAHVCICHTDILLDTKDMKAIMDLGVYLEFDNFGKEFLAKNAYGTFPSDARRMQALYELIDAGYTDRLLVSCDICLKNLLSEHNGPGYAHILQKITPMLRAKYQNAEEILHRILVQNPANYLDNQRLDLL